jgi:hypothetical protein
MRTFKGFNPEGKPCPICHTKEDKECVLVPMLETQEGHNYEAIAVHVGCLELVSTLLPGGKRLIHHCDPI